MQQALQMPDTDAYLYKPDSAKSEDGGDDDSAKDVHGAPTVWLMVMWRSGRGGAITIAIRLPLGPRSTCSSVQPASITRRKNSSSIEAVRTCSTVTIIPLSGSVTAASP